MAVKFCFNCSYPIGDGHILDYFFNYKYYCDEGCLRKDNPELDHMSLEEMYIEEYQFYTSWYDDDDYELFEAYKVDDTFHINKEYSTSNNSYWILGNGSEYEYGDTFKEDSTGIYKIFSTLDEGRIYYLEHIG